MSPLLANACEVSQITKVWPAYKSRWTASVFINNFNENCNKTGRVPSDTSCTNCKMEAGESKDDHKCNKCEIKIPENWSQPKLVKKEHVQWRKLPGTYITWRNEAICWRNDWRNCSDKRNTVSQSGAESCASKSYRQEGIGNILHKFKQTLLSLSAQYKQTFQIASC